MENNKYIELRKKIIALAATGTIGLTTITGCGAKANTDSSTKTALPTVSTTIETTVETTAEETKVETTEDMATVEYMNRAKVVASAMYEKNKEYFDEKQYTVEDLENVYYVLNGKYYNNEKQLIMDRPELMRSFNIIRELVMPQRVNEIAQKYNELEKNIISEKDYFDEVNASKFYDYTMSLSNFIDVNEKNNDIRDFANEYSNMMNKVTLNLKNGVSPVEILKENFVEMRKAQTGNLSGNSVYKNINNYLGNDGTTKDGQALFVAASYKATADYLNTLIDGYYVTVPVENTKENEAVKNEKVRIGFSYNEQFLVNAYYLGDLVETKDILKAKKLIIELFQTMPFDVMCYRENKINTNFGYEPVKENNTYTK